MEGEGIYTSTAGNNYKGTSDGSKWLWIFSIIFWVKLCWRVDEW